MQRLSLALMLSLAAFSAQAQEADPAAPAVEEAAAAPEETVEIQSDATVAKADNSRCIQQTGSRIKRRDANGCNGLAGRSYSSEDIDSTGAASASDALRMLDPSISR